MARAANPAYVLPLRRKRQRTILRYRRCLARRRRRRRRRQRPLYLYKQALPLPPSLTRLFKPLVRLFSPTPVAPALPVTSVTPVRPVFIRERPMPQPQKRYYRRYVMDRWGGIHRRPPLPLPPTRDLLCKFMEEDDESD